MPPISTKQRPSKRTRQTKLNFPPSSSSPAVSSPPRHHGNYDDEDDSDYTRPTRYRASKKRTFGTGFFGSTPAAKRARSPSEEEDGVDEDLEEERLKKSIREKKRQRQGQIALNPNAAPALSERIRRSGNSPGDKQNILHAEEEQLKSKIREKKWKGRSGKTLKDANTEQPTSTIPTSSLTKPIVLEDEDGNEEESLPVNRKVNRKNKGKNARGPSLSDDDLLTPKELLSLHYRSGSEKRRNGIVSDEAEESDYDGDEVKNNLDNSDTGSQLRAGGSGKPNDKTHEDKLGSKIGVVDLSDSSDDLPARPTRNSKSRRRIPQQPSKNEDNDEDDLPITPGRRHRKNVRIPIPALVSDDNSDDDSEPISVKRRRHSSPMKQIKTDEEGGNDDDIGSDAELAAHTPKTTTRTRMGQRKKLNPFQRKLAELNAKRKGIEYISEEEEEDTSPRKALYDSSTDSSDDVRKLGTDEDDLGQEGEEEEDAIYDVQNALFGRSTRLGSDSDLDSFIVSDTEDNPDPSASHNTFIGAPDASSSTSIPIQFTAHSHANTRTHFKTATFFFLQQILLSPPPNRSLPSSMNKKRKKRHADAADPSHQDEYTRYALHFLERKINIFRDSVLASSAWRPDFLLALRSRPGFSYEEETGGEMEHCTACNRRDRHATFAIRFTGPPYDLVTLEDLPPRKWGRGRGEETDSLGNVIPPESTRFPVGRFCFERAEITHSFWHWKKGLRVALEGLVERMGVWDDVWADQKDSDDDGDESQEVREQRAVKVMKKLDEDGDIGLMYDMFEAQISRAEEFMVKSKSKRY